MKLNFSYAQQESLPSNIYAGPDKIYDQNSTVALNAVFLKSQFDNSSLQWRQISGEPDVTLIGDNQTNAAFVTPIVSNDTIFTFEFSARDASGKVEKDTVNILVRAVDMEGQDCVILCLPISDAGPDQTVISNTSVILDGSKSKTGSEVLGNKLNYTWYQVQGPPVLLSNPTDPRVTFNAPTSDKDEMLVFVLEVHQYRDSGNSPSLLGLISDGDPIDIEVKRTTNESINRVDLIANAGDDQEVKSGNLVILNGTNSTGTVRGLTSYEWTQVHGDPKVSLDNFRNITSSFVAPASSIGANLTFGITVSDNLGRNSSDTVNVKITDGNQSTNQAPVAQDQSVTTTVDQPVEITLGGTDEDGDELTAVTVSEPSNGELSEIDQDTANVTYTPNPDFDGTDEFTFKVNDTDDESEPATVSITVESDCVEDTVRDQFGQCVPVEQTCEEGNILDETGQCVPVEQTCEEGNILDGTGQCVPVE